MSNNFIRGQTSETDRLVDFFREHSRLTVLTGAGCSSASGIPTYRDDDGNWMHQQPMQFADFVGHASKRRRYWAQSFAGWHRISKAKPNAAHHAIADLELSGIVSCVITQNVDNLHQAAGSRNVLENATGLVFLMRWFANSRKVVSYTSLSRTAPLPAKIMLGLLYS